jgi:hypothetical protein
MTFGKTQDEAKNSALYWRYVSERAFGARAVGPGSANSEELNVLAINDLGPTADKDFPALLQMAQPALNGHGWGVYCFHGVGGDWLSITPEALDQLTAHFEEHSDVWTAPFGDVLRYVQERKAASIRVEQSGSDSVNLSVGWPLDKSIYDVPLTLKLEVPSVWQSVSASADGKALDPKITKGTPGTVIVVDVPAQTMRVRLTGKSSS